MAVLGALVGAGAVRGNNASKPATNNAAAVARGKTLFQQKCAVCHYDTSDQKKIGPGLKGLSKRATARRKQIPRLPGTIISGGRASGREAPPGRQLKEKSPETWLGPDVRGFSISNSPQREENYFRTASFRAFAGRRRTTVFALILICSPV